MTQADERILEFLYEKDIVASPPVIAANLDYTGDYISRRCSELADYELIQRVDASNYQITALGERFLMGEVEADELESEDEDDE